MDITDAATLPEEIRLKLLEIRDALIRKDVDEAYHVLYSIADPKFESYEPWQSLEQANPADAKQPCEHDFVRIVAWACTKCGFLRR